MDLLAIWLPVGEARCRAVFSALHQSIVCVIVHEFKLKYLNSMLRVYTSGTVVQQKSLQQKPLGLSMNMTANQDVKSS